MIYPVIALYVTWGGLSAVFFILFFLSLRIAIWIVNYVDKPETPQEAEARTLKEWLALKYGPELSEEARKQFNLDFPWRG